MEGGRAGGGVGARERESGSGEVIGGAIEVREKRGAVCRGGGGISRIAQVGVLRGRGTRILRGRPGLT